MLQDLKGKLRYLAGLRGFLNETVSPAEARDLIRRGIAQREESFLRLIERGVYGNPRSPYRRLLVHAGVEFGDLRAMVVSAGLENALARLHDEGVYVTQPEMHGVEPIRRKGLEFWASSRDFDNPLLVNQYEVTSSGSRSAGSRSFTDLTLLAHEAAYYCLMLHAHGAAEMPVGVWRLVPPSFQGLNGILRYSRAGQGTVQWFSQRRIPGALAGIRSRLLLHGTRFVARRAGKHIPWPRFVPQDEAVTVAGWLGEMTRNGTPALLDTTASGAVRVAIAAAEHRIDISGSVFRTGGEPYTPAKAALVASGGARAINAYAASELGVGGIGCAAPEDTDDLHLVTDKVVLGQRPKVIDRDGTTVTALVYTTLLTNCRKIMINAESGDSARVIERRCGCALDEAGLTTHLLGLHGYDKMTSEGMTFMAAELFRLVEEVLPRSFGGHPTDYQLVEQEDENGIARVNVVVSPSVGEVDDDRVVSTVLQALRSFDPSGRGPAMAAQWQQGRTLRVMRRRPFTSAGRKVMPLHVVRSRSSEPEPGAPAKRS